MINSIRIRRLPATLALVAVAVLGLVLAVAGAAGSEPGKQRAAERLVVRGEDTVKDGGQCPGGVCNLELTDGTFRGTVGTGQYDGSVELRVAEAFANGEGGLCAPVSGRIVLGAGSPDRLVIGLRGDSCPGRQWRRHAGVLHGRHRVRGQARHRRLREDEGQRHGDLLRGRLRPRAHDAHRNHLPLIQASDRRRGQGGPASGSEPPLQSLPTARGDVRAAGDAL